MSAKLKFMLLTGMFIILTQIATTSAASASYWFVYQPELPESLKE